MIALHAAICDSIGRFCKPTLPTLNHLSILHLIQERIDARQLGSTLWSREREGAGPPVDLSQRRIWHLRAGQRGGTWPGGGTDSLFHYVDLPLQVESTSQTPIELKIAAVL